MRHSAILATPLATVGIVAAKPSVACWRSSCGRALRAANVEDLTSDSYIDCADPLVVFITMTLLKTAFYDVP